MQSLILVFRGKCLIFFIFLFLILQEVISDIFRISMLILHTLVMNYETDSYNYIVNYENDPFLIMII